MLEDEKKPKAVHFFYIDAFFRLHRRRGLSETGFQALSYQDMASLADQVLGLHPSERKLFFRVIEETDNAVLYDHHTKNRETAEEQKKEAEKTRKASPAKRVRRR